MAVYLAYYKDIIFSLLIILNYGGMLHVTNSQIKDSNGDNGHIVVALEAKKWLNLMLFLSVLFWVMTVTRYWKHAIYWKNWEYRKIIKEQTEKAKKKEEEAKAKK